MATAGVAAAFREDGKNVPMKTRCAVAGCVPDRHGCWGCGGIAFESYFCGAVRDGVQFARLVNPHDVSIFHDELGFLNFRTRGVCGGVGFEGEQLLARFGAIEGDGFGVDARGRNGG